MWLDQYLDIDKLSWHVKEGYVTRSFHNVHPLVLYCYSRKASYEDLWDDVTTKTRGLIVSTDTMEIVARPYEKFFNIDTLNRPETHLVNLPDCDVHRPLITDKVDGSLGIMWTYHGSWGLATKGSFYSDQAVWATDWLKNHCHTYPDFPWGWTPVFEIVSEAIQHHVVHYGNDRLVLLGLINNETGEEADYQSLRRIAHKNLLEVVQAYDVSINDILRQDRANKEGYVVTWNYQSKPPFKLKIKHPTFLRNQRILHTATPKNILDLVSNADKELLNNWMNASSEPIRQYMQKWIRIFEDEYHRIFQVAHVLLFEALQKYTTRKEVALFLNNPKNKPYAAVCFAILDNTTNSANKYKHLIWKMVKQRIDLNDKSCEQCDNEVYDEQLRAA